MNIVVAGGTGFLGVAITEALVASGHSVTVASRSRPRRAGSSTSTSWRHADVTDAATLGEALEGAQVVVDAVQFPNMPVENASKGFTFENIDLRGTQRLVDAAVAAGASLFIGLSGVGASADAPYHWLRYKSQEEDYIRASGLPFVIFRPSWIYGPRDVSLNRFLGFSRWLPFVPVIGDGKTRINPLFVGDLGAVVAAAIARPDVYGRTFEVGGPAVMTMDEVVRTALRVLGRRRFLLHAPKAVMKLAGSVAAHLPGPPLTADAVEFITMDGVADNAAIEGALGPRLTPLRDGLATYL